MPGKDTDEQVIDGKDIWVERGRVPTAMPKKDMDDRVFAKSAGEFYSHEGGSEHLVLAEDDGMKLKSKTEKGPSKKLKRKKKKLLEEIEAMHPDAAAIAVSEDWALEMLEAIFDDSDPVTVNGTSSRSTKP